MSNNVELNEYYYRNSDNELYFIHYYNTRFAYVSKMVLKNETKTIKINESLNVNPVYTLAEYQSDKYDFKIKTYHSIKTEKEKIPLKDFYFKGNTFKCDTKNNSDIRLLVNIHKNKYNCSKSVSLTDSKIEDIIYQTQREYVKDIIEVVSEHLFNEYLKNDECLLDEREDHKEYNARQKEYFESENQKKNRAYQVKMLKTFKAVQGKYLEPYYNLISESTYCYIYKVIQEYLKTIDIDI